MKVSVVVVTFNSEKDMPELLDTLVRVDYPKKDYEVLIVDGGSKDNTHKIVGRYAKKHKNVRLIVDPGKYIASGRNVGIREARYPYIAYTDSDCRVPKNWLKVYVKGFKELKKKHKKLAGLGGINFPPKKSTDFMQATAIMHNTFFGSMGSIQTMQHDEIKPMRSVSCTNSFYEKKALESIGGFQKKLKNQGEDWDLGLRMRRKGHLLLSYPKSHVLHLYRPTPSKFWKNMVFYGDGRALLMKVHPDELEPIYFVPILFVIAEIASFIGVWFCCIFWIPLLYFPFMLLYSIFLGVKEGKVHLSLHVFLAFLILHFGYGIGEIKGLLRKHR